MVRGMINSILSPPPFDFYAPLLAKSMHLSQPPFPYKSTMTALVLIKQCNLEPSICQVR